VTEIHRPRKRSRRRITEAGVTLELGSAIGTRPHLRFLKVGTS
jgi:hypothetical protein